MPCCWLVYAGCMLFAGWCMLVACWLVVGCMLVACWLVVGCVLVGGWIPLLALKGGVGVHNVPNLVHSESKLSPDSQSLSDYTVCL